MRDSITKTVALALGLAAGAVMTSCEEGVKVQETGVSHELAEWRKTNYRDVEYELTFSIPKKRDEAVTGTVRISLTLQRPEAVIIDFRETADHVKGVFVEDAEAEYVFENEHIVIPQGCLVTGINHVSIEFVAGDQSLNRRDEFLYTLLVPDRARTLFPCFDQPNLKAHYTLQLEVPEGWTAVSNTYIDKEETAADGRKLITFGKTEPLSTYLFSFVAGILQRATYDDGRHTFSAYYRETDPKKLAQMDDIFHEVAASLEWLEEYTDIPYPFAKYDLIILPGFQYGGMEHTGATLYNDTRMFLSEHPTLDERLGRTQLIAHETAHMWFGDLVTMDWFDDVWTKEVFANHYAAEITSPIYPSVNHRLNTMRSFNTASLAEDRTLGTTAIQQPLDNLSNAGLVYGNIIYNKAPVMMEKMIEIMGEDDFRKGIRTYLKRFSYANAKWDDLIAILDSISSADLKQFSEAWVSQKGMPDITVTTTDNQLIVTQSDPYARGVCWPQSFQVSLISSDGQQVDVDVKLESGCTVVPLSFTPQYVLPNTDGRGYARFLPDKQSLEYMLATWPQIGDETARFATLMNLYENWLAHRISDESWSKSLLAGLPEESNLLIASSLTGFIGTVVSEMHGESRADVERDMLDMSRTHKSLQTRQQLFRSLYRCAIAPEVVDYIFNVWDSMSDKTMSETDYTTMAYELALHRPEQYSEIIAKQRSRISNPDRISQFDFIAPSVSPDEATLDSVFSALMLKENRRTEPYAARALAYLNHPLRVERAVKYIRPGLDVLQEVQRTGDIFFPRNWIGVLLGNHYSPEAYAEVERFLEENPEYPQLLKNKILQAAYWLYRANGKYGEIKTIE